MLQKVPGIELWQVGELAVWNRVAAWLGEMHARFADRIDSLRRDSPHLLDHSADWYRTWRDRARSALSDSPDPRAPELARTLDDYDHVIEILAALPRTFVHGELYPSNVMVVRDEEPVGVYPVDWEMAAVGPGLIDLAALVGGWGPGERAELQSAYLQGLQRRRWAGPGHECGEPRRLELPAPPGAPVARVGERLAAAARACARLARGGRGGDAGARPRVMGSKPLALGVLH